MPAKKPVDLQTRHATKSEKLDRVESEESMRSERPVPKDPPAQLKKNPIAMATWRRLIREYSRVEAVIVSRLDIDLLIDYCVLTSQLDEIDRLRSTAIEVWTMLNKQRVECIEKAQMDQALSLADKISKLFETILKLDGRTDRKRDMLVKIRQSMYMTPRARAGTAPKVKATPPPEDPFETYLDEVSTRTVKNSDGGPGDGK